MVIDLNFVDNCKKGFFYMKNLKVGTNQEEKAQLISCCAQLIQGSRKMSKDKLYTLNVGIAWCLNF